MDFIYGLIIGIFGTLALYSIINIVIDIIDIIKKNHK